MQAIQAQDITYTTDGKTIIEGINLTIEPGEFVGLIGPNGSGKSTLLKILYQSISKYQGTAYIHGKDLRQVTPKDFAKHASVLTQEHETAFNFKVKDMVELSRFAFKKFYESPDKSDQEICKQALEKVGMLDYLDRDYLTLSGGEKQRVMMAMAFAKENKTFILDEPTNHLDISHQMNIMDSLKAEKDTTVFSSLHDLNIASKYCQKLILLCQGKIVEAGPTEEVLRSKKLEKAFQVRITLTKMDDGNLSIYYSPMEKDK